MKSSNSKKLREIVENDFISLKKGTIDPNKAFKLYTVIRTMLIFDDAGKVKKQIEKFLKELKKQYPDIHDFLKDNK